jgi:DNA-binding LacI/PurR family transcriptional regulator
MLESKTPPTAIVAVNDTLAVELVDLLQKDGYSVPQDVSVFGFNDDADSKNSKPQISTVRIDKIKLAQTGAKMIIDRIENPELSHQKVSLPTELIHRASVAVAKR